MGDGSQRPSHGGERPAVYNDWRVNFNPDIRRRKVNFILDFITGPGPIPNREAYASLKHDIEKLEEKIYTDAPSMHDYLMKTSGFLEFFDSDDVFPHNIRNPAQAQGFYGLPSAIPRPFIPAPNPLEDTATSGSVPRDSNFRGFPVGQGSSSNVVRANSQRQQQIPQQYLANVNYNPPAQHQTHHQQLDAVRLDQIPVYVQSRQHPNPLRQNMPRRLQAPDQNSGLLPQRQNVINQQNQAQRAPSDASSRDSSVGDWQQAIYQRITQMKDRYLHDICGIYWEKAGKSLQGQPESEHSQNPILLLEMAIRFLLVLKPNVVPMNKETLDRHERDILQIINSLGPSEAGSQMQVQGQPESLQASSSHTTSTQQQQNHPVINSPRSNAVATEQPIDSLTRTGDCLRSIESVVSSGDRIAGSAPGVGSRSAVGADLRAETMHRNSMPINANALSGNSSNVPGGSNQSSGPESCEVDPNATSSFSKRPKIQEGE